MSEKETTRRTVLRTLGAAGAVAAVPATSAATDDWTTNATPTDSTLTDVEYATNGAYAVGKAGVLLEHTPNGWTKVTDGGASGDSRDLYGADVTDDGERVWFVGASGAIGEYDVTTGNINDRSAPQDNTNNFLDVAVTGQAGEANVYVADASGIVSYSFENGESGTWNSVQVGQGYALTAIDFYDARDGHVVNTNGRAFVTHDGTSFDKIGVGDANGSFYGVDSDGADDVWVCGSNGTVFHYDGKWTKTSLGDPTLRDIKVTDDDGFTVGESGRVFDRTDGTWSEDTTATGQNLKGVVRGDPDFAVGAGSVVIEN